MADEQSGWQGTVAGRTANGAGTILVLESDAAVRDYLRRTLERRGFGVIAAADSAAAVEAARAYEGTIDLLLCDRDAEGIGSRDVVEQVGEAHPEARVLLVTVREGDLDEADILYVDAVLPKPFSPDVLAGVVRALLE